mgnify:CR=1 FL=1
MSVSGCVPGYWKRFAFARSRSRCVAHLSALQSVLVEEPGEAEVVGWLQGLAPRYEQHHGVLFTRAALRAAAGCAKR